MGRCYEFAAVIVDGCEHAMRVGPDGGACECPTCGAHCTGRFTGCASILEQPGFVPESAPDWAVQCLPPPGPSERFHPPGHRGSSAATTPAGAAADVAAVVRAELGSTTDELREIVTLALANPRNANRDDAALSASLEDAVDHAHARFGDALVAQFQQALRPLMEQQRAQLLDAIDALRAELLERTEDREVSASTTEGLTRVAQRVGRLERSLGVAPEE